MSGDTNDTVPGALDAIHRRLDDGDQRFKTMQEELTRNTAATNRIEQNTSDMLDFFDTMRGAFKFFNLIGRAAKPLFYIASAVGAVLGAIAAIKAGHGIGPK